MARGFGLSGLLRLRHLQEEQAGAALGAARRRAAEQEQRVTMVREQLDGSLSEVTDSTALRAVAAARASTRSMLTELEGLAARHRTEADERQAEYTESRRRAVALEKLERRHLESQDAEELRSEQIGLDELAVVRWQQPAASANTSTTRGGNA